MKILTDQSSFSWEDLCPMLQKSDDMDIENPRGIKRSQGRDNNKRPLKKPRMNTNEVMDVEQLVLNNIQHNTSYQNEKNFLYAAKNGFSKAVYLMLEYTAINPATHDYLAFRSAAEKGNTEVIQLLLHYSNPALNYQHVFKIPSLKCIVQDNKRGPRIALQNAAFMGHLDVVKLLLNDRRIVLEDVYRALKMAVWNTHVEIIKLLIHNISLESQSLKTDAETLLHIEKLLVQSIKKNIATSYPNSYSYNELIWILASRNGLFDRLISDVINLLVDKSCTQESLTLSERARSERKNVWKKFSLFHPARDPEHSTLALLTDDVVRHIQSKLISF